MPVVKMHCACVNYLIPPLYHLTCLPCSSKGVSYGHAMNYVYVRCLAPYMDNCIGLQV